MAFTENQFPPEINQGSGGGPMFNTEIATTTSGYETRNKKWSQARHKYNVSMGVRGAVDFEELKNFYMAMNGRANGFRFKDWGDYKSGSVLDSVTNLDQVIGTGDGVNKVFQVVKTYTDGLAYTRTIKKLVTGTLIVAVDGVATAAYTVDITTGIITFTTAPLDTLVVTAGYEFDVPCRFDTDSMQTIYSNFLIFDTELSAIEIRE